MVEGEKEDSRKKERETRAENAVKGDRNLESSGTPKVKKTRSRRQNYPSREVGRRVGHRKERFSRSRSSASRGSRHRRFYQGRRQRQSPHRTRQTRSLSNQKHDTVPPSSGNHANRNRDLPKTLEEIIERLGKTKKRILIELYKDSVGYKKLSKILGVGLDTIRSHIKSGKYSTSLQEIGLVERGDNGGWQLTALGLQVCELLQEDPELRSFFY